MLLLVHVVHVGHADFLAENWALVEPTVQNCFESCVDKLVKELIRLRNEPTAVAVAIALVPATQLRSGQSPALERLWACGENCRTADEYITNP